VIVAVSPGSLLAMKMVKDVFGIAGKDIQDGVDILCQAALNASFADASGKYFDNDIGSFSQPNPAAIDANHASDVMRTIGDCAERLDSAYRQR
jgi:hypothetical protein